MIIPCQVDYIVSATETSCCCVMLDGHLFMALELHIVDFEFP